ncbi:polymorphic toxin type 44 domain-containing protein [Pseudomonas sp. BJa5]|uniref:polymorphic toxin type 44 domain-containing protein n=1 Tax=Pseudomonas sp. BJa5 TaxID=2936270 RepID=UPI0025599376|nr:polymorphic toxin type 44 domain-containing protein [Pseudomonas sp. BGr12]MDL2422398.1 polymorphic toxin type 44 domain-containing protein [Pseudomonas sp. BGr12]
MEQLLKGVDMATGHFIRLGDKTTCGGTVLEADTRVMMFGIAHAREGDRVSCGKDGKAYPIVGGVSFISSHGRYVAGTLDSISGCPCKARLLPSSFNASYESRRNATPRDSGAVDQAPSFSGNGPAQTASMTNVRTPPHADASPLVPPEQLDEVKTAPIACNHPDQMEELAKYIAGEMNRNIRDPAVLEMKSLINYDPDVAAKQFSKLPFFARLGGSPNYSDIAKAKKAAAAAIWTKKVGQDMEWDHKPKLIKLFGTKPWHKQGAYDYYYDIWSNIHYGYVGIAAGLSDSVLLDGAGVEQIGSDLYRQARNPEKFKGPRRTDGVEGMRAWDDVPDRVSIVIGMNLYKEYPDGGVTAKIIMDKVLAVPIVEWATGIQKHDCT